MTSKERVKAAINLKMADRVPYGEFAIDFDMVEKILGHETYLRAKAKSKIAFWEGRRDEVVQSWKEDAVELYKKLDFIDIVNLGAASCGIVPPNNYIPNSPNKIDNKTWEDSEGKIYKLSETTMDLTMVYDPHLWQREYKIEDYNREPDYSIPDKSIFEVIDYIIEKLGADKYIIGHSGDPVEAVMLATSMERSLMEYVLNPNVVKAAAGYRLKRGNFEDAYFIRKGQDAVCWSDDFAHNTGPMISPEMFNEFVVPFAKERVDHIRNHFKLPVIKHACGNNWKLLDMFVEIGYACYQSIQPTADMDIRKVKELFGSKICLWGGIPVEHLVDGTRDDIKKDVAYALKSAKRNGGYIFGSSHSIAVGVKYDNFMIMIDEFLKGREY